MRLPAFGARLLLLGSAVVLGIAVTAGAQAHSRHAGRAAWAGRQAHGAWGAGLVRSAAWFHGGHARFRRYAGGGSVLQCVAFAREDSGVQLTGNAADWWDNAEGLYARGPKPESGSVLSFRANGHMRLGHVAVVTDVVDARTIEIDHSHWGSGGVSHSMSVIDVSENNDWSAVRVEVGHTGSFGGIYPTHGFIYPRPDGGPHLEQASADITPRLPVQGERRRAARYEVAEAPASPHAIDLSFNPR